MEQKNPLNEIVKQLKGALGGFLTPQVTFIINSAFAVVAFVLFILQPYLGLMGYKSVSLISVWFAYAGGILGFLVLLGLTISAIALPLKTKKLSPCLNSFLIGFMFLVGLAMIPRLGVITILLWILILLPWALFTLIKKGDEVSL